MIGILMILIAAVMIISGVTGRWRAVLAAIAPGFSHGTSAVKTATAV